MKPNQIILLIFILFSVQLSAQNLSKGFGYIDEHEYDKAMKIFTKAINNQKDVVAGKYGVAVILTRPDYEQQSFVRSYNYLLFVEKQFSGFSSYAKEEYEESYGMSVKTIDSLKQWILNTEYNRAITGEGMRVSEYLKTFDETEQAKKLENYRDSIRYDDVLRAGSVYDFQKFITDFPNSIYKSSAVIQRDIVWRKMYNDSYRSIEVDMITSFEKKYPDYPYYNDSTKIYRKLAFDALQLKLYLGYLKSTNNYYGSFIMEAAPHEMAFQALLVLLQPDIELDNRQNAIDTINKYKPFFGDFDKIDKLIEIIERPEMDLNPQSVGNKLNTDAYEYMPVLTADNKTMYFCGEGRADNLSVKGEDIFVSFFKNGSWSQGYLVTDLSTESKNEAPLSVSPDGNTLNLFSNGNVYFSEKTKYGWTRIEPFEEINTKQNWEADAVMSADGNAVFFASDRPGNVGAYHPFSGRFHGDYVGNLDIYVCVKTDDGWSQPINIGSTINTPYAERTPFLHPDMKTLYFSSDGHAGIGKIDVFKSTRLNDSSWTEWSEPVNLGFEINSPKKEYGYKISTDGTKAFYTQFIDNQSDIYSITLPEENRPEQVAIISGTVTNINEEPLQSDIFWEDLETGKKLGNLKTDPQSGQYIITLPLGRNYGFFVSKSGYYPLSDNIDLRNYDGNIEITKDFQLTKISDIVYGDATIELKNVFFDSDKVNLKKESYPELKRLAEFIKSQQNIKVEISGHTDNKGTKEYNKTLSLNRANQVKIYLISLGCDENQMTTVGYGDEKPIANNTTEEGRQKNRRVEFKVINN